MTSRHFKYPSGQIERVQQPLKMDYSKVYPKTPRTATKTQYLNRSHVERTNQIFPCKKPLWQVETKHSMERSDLSPESNYKSELEQQKEELDYVEHLRRIAKHLQQTTAILEQKKQLNKKIYKSSLKKIDETKQNIWIRKLKMQKQMQELRVLLQEYQRQN